MSDFSKLLPICAIVALLFSFGASAAPAEEITDQVKYKVSSGSTKYIKDDSIKTAWAPAGDEAELYMEFPEGGVGYVRVDWMFDSPGYVFTQYDADKKELTSRTEKDSYAGITQLFPIERDARYAMLRLTEPGQEICNVSVYAKGDLPKEVPNFEPPWEKCDLMVVSTHQDDEFIYFGGIIPYYGGVRGKKVQVVYMANCGRLRRGEALNGLWAAGHKSYPDFINLKDKRVDTFKQGVELWGGKDAILEKLVARIRRYKPEVILTHDLDGESGHNQHKITANAMKMAIEAAADPAQFPGTAAEYGAWQVKKLYLHLYSESVIDFDWNVAYDELGGKTPLQVARAGYAMHVSQQEYDSVKDGGEYDNSLFGLAYSTVGEDVRRDDLFENVEAADAIAPLTEESAEPTPEPTPGPTPEPALLFSPEPAPAQTFFPQPSEALGPTAIRIGLFVIGGVALLAVLSGAQAFWYARRGRRK